MKRSILFGIVLVLTSVVNAQPISGIKSIPGNYATIQAAISALNAQGVGTGGVTFVVALDHAEILANATAGTITATGTLTDTIIFKRATGTGANPKITAFTPGISTTVDGMIKISGGDYIVFDGIDLEENAANNSATKQMEWGYAMVKKQNSAPFDGCQHVVIRNCSITLNKSNVNSVGIYSGNHISTAITALTITATTDACNNCRFDNNTISNAYTGIELNGYAAPSPYTLYDHNNEVGKYGKNHIFNFGGSSSAAYGIYATYQDLISIMNDSIVGGAGTTGRVAGILLQAGISASAEISSNYISVSSGATGANNLYGIWNLLGSSPLQNTIKIHHNKIVNCSYPTATTGPFYGILNSASADTVMIHNNEISGTSLPGSGSQYLIRSDASGNIQHIYENDLHDHMRSSSGSFIAIFTSSFSITNIYANAIYNCGSTGGTVYGVQAAAGQNSYIYTNTIYNLSSNNGNTASSLVYGIYNAGAQTATIYNNFITSLKADAATNNPSICGLYLPNGTTNKVYNNTVYINASSSGTTFGTAALYAFTTPALDLRNNILVNVSTPSASGYTIAYRRSGTSLGSYSATSNYNDFYAGIPGPNNFIYYDGTNAEQTISGYKSRVAPKDALSFSENPPFIEAVTEPYNLHLSSSLPTFCESGGMNAIPATSVDIDGDPRYPNTGYPDNPAYPATGEDVGADEFAGIRNDLTPPVISFTPLQNTSTIGSRSLVASITDAKSGVPRSGSGLPVLYWKISLSETWSSSPANYLGGDQYSFTFGTGAVSGDFVLYYICAQDSFLIPNVTSNALAGASSFAANPPRCTVSPSTPDGYRVVESLPGGNYLVGGNGTTPSPGCTFVNLAQAFGEINNTLSGITLTSGGSGYTYTPEVTISGGGGATASAVLSNDTIVSIEVTNPGNGYLFPPEITITGDGSGAVATAIISAGKEVTGHVSFILTDTWYSFEEDILPVTLYPFAGAGSDHTVTVKPASGVSHVFIGLSNTSLIKLDGADYFTLDGSNNGTTSRNLELWNLVTGGNRAVVWLAGKTDMNGATHNTIKNCVMHGNGSPGPLAGIFSGGTSAISLASFTLSPNSGNTFENNQIYNVQNGIVVNGKSGTETDANNTIKDNLIGKPGAGNELSYQGISVLNQDNITVSGNEVQNVTYAGHSNFVYGIYLQDVKNATVAGNKIHDLSYTYIGDNWPLDGIFQRCTAFSTLANPSNNLYYNNVIFNLTSTSTSSTYNVVGIHNNGGFGDKYFYNSVYLAGQLNGPGVSNSMSACFANGRAINTGESANIEVRNNIFCINGYSPPGNYITDTAYYYAHYTTATSYSGSIINNNDLVASASGRAKAYIGRINNINYFYFTRIECK